MKNWHHHVSAIEAVTARLSASVKSNDMHGQKLVGISRGLSDSVKAITTLHDTPNPVETSAAHQKRVGNAAKKLEAQRQTSFDKIQTTVRDGLSEIDGRIGAKVKLVPNEKYGAEIRAAFRTLSPADQVKMLSELAATNAGPELAAIVSVPAILTGITADTQDLYRGEIVAIHAREELLEKEALMEAFKTALVVADVALDVANEFSNPERLASIERGEEAATAADAAFNNATAGVVA